MTLLGWWGPGADGYAPALVVAQKGEPRRRVVEPRPPHSLPSQGKAASPSPANPRRHPTENPRCHPTENPRCARILRTG
jgi:hypothetical protein